MRNSIWKSFAIIFLGALSCVPGTSPIRLVGVHAVDTGMTGTECLLDSDIFQTGGLLDASGGGDYLVVLEVDSELNAGNEIISNKGVPLTGSGKRNFTVDALLLTYRTTNPVLQLMAETIPTTFAIPPSSTDNRLAVDIIGDKAADTMRTMLSDTMRKTQLTVNIQLRGHAESGEVGTSNIISFPIEVRTTNAPCPEPGNVTRTGPCGVRGGQDFTTFTCCTTGVPMANCL